VSKIRICISVFVLIKQIHGWIFAKEIKHVSIIKMFCNIHHCCFKAGGFKRTKKLLTALTHNLTLQQIIIYTQTPAEVFLVHTRIWPSQQLTEHTGSAVYIF